jgi:cytochrome c553
MTASSRSRLATALVALAVLLVASFWIGFITLPKATADFAKNGVWDAICRAAGVPREWLPPAQTESAGATRVVLVPGVADGGDVGRGGTLALRCTMCHGARGVSASDVPNLAGQYPEVIFKQLMDYKTGRRTHALMQSLAQTMSEQDMRDLAAFYAQLPRPSPAPATPPPPRLVQQGDPIRNIAPCASCHGGIDHKLGSPWLEGMPAAFISAQLHAFAQEERRNDPLDVMRNAARQMTPEEIDEVARFYASRAVRFEPNAR